MLCGVGGRRSVCVCARVCVLTEFVFLLWVMQIGFGIEDDDKGCVIHFTVL